MSAGTGRTLLVAFAEQRIVIEEAQDPGQPRTTDLGAPSVDGFPVSGDVTDGRHQRVPVDLVPWQHADGIHRELPPVPVGTDGADHLDHAALNDTRDLVAVRGPERSALQPPMGVPERQDGVRRITATGLHVEHHERILHPRADGEFWQNGLGHAIASRTSQY